MNYTTVTLTAIKEGDTVVLLDSRGVAITRVETERCGKASGKALRRREWHQWAVRAINYDPVRRWGSQDDPWYRKVGMWIQCHRRRVKYARRRNEGRYRHEAYSDTDWSDAIRRMMSASRHRVRSADRGEWDTWSQTVTSNANRRWRERRGAKGPATLG